MQNCTNKPLFQMLVGLPGSGKSTYAANYKATNDRVRICSSDEIRAELGDVNDQTNNEKVFRILHRRIKDYLREGYTVIYDATNIHSKRRRAFLVELGKIDCKKQCIVFRTSYKTCLANNAKRERKVPEDVIRRMYMSWDTPHWFEGWDDILIYDNEKDYDEFVRRRPGEFIKDTVGFDQNSLHHSLSLGNHCVATASLLKSDIVLKYAGMLHDCGKPFCKTYRNSKGKIDKYAHYYNHEHVGAYEALFYNSPGMKETLEISTLINLHMKPFGWEMDTISGEKTRCKYYRLWGEDLYNKVMALHEADRLAH